MEDERHMRKDAQKQSKDMQDKIDYLSKEFDVTRESANQSAQTQKDLNSAMVKTQEENERLR